MNVDIINEVIAWLKLNWVFLTMLALGAWYGKTAFKVFIFEPLAGGNGHIQMDELAKGIVLTVFILATYRDGTRAHEWAFFSDSFYAILLAAVCGIASIKPATDMLSSYFKSKYGNANEQPDTGNLPTNSNS